MSHLHPTPTEQGAVDHTGVLRLRHDPAVLQRLARPTIGSPASSAPALARLDHRIGVASGLVLVAVGIIAITVAWSKAAGSAIVAEQIPYVISGGLGGVAAVAAGSILAAASIRIAELSEQLRNAQRIADLTEALRIMSEERS